MKHCTLLLVICILYHGTSAQGLKQKGFIGVVPQPVTETIRKFLALEADKGALVVSVIPGSVAEKAGIRENDVLLAINAKEVQSPKDVVDISGQLLEGDPITFRIDRNKQRMDLKGVVTPRPLGFPPEIDIELHAVPFEKGHIRSILFKPVGSKGALPVIYLLQGYPCFSMGYLAADHPYRTAITAFVKKGYAVYVTEKPGMGDSKGTSPCDQIGFDTELSAFKKGYDHLLTLNSADKNRIFLFGHSLGGFVAPLIAEQYRPKGVIVYGAGMRPWHDYLVDLVREQMPYQGIDMADSEDSLAKYREVLYRYFFERKTPQQLIAEKKENDQVLRSFLSFDGKDQLIQRHYRFWQELNRYNLTRAWKNTTAPVLSLFGEADIAALKPDDMERIAQVVEQYHPGNGRYVFIPGTNHDMIRTGTMQENMKIQFSPGYQQYLKNNFNHEIIDLIDKWIREIK